MKKLLFYSLMLLVFAGCGDDDDEVVDFRLQAVGEYSYTISLTNSFGSFSDSGDLTVQTLGSTGLRLIFDQGDSDSFTLDASGTVQASNGVAFNVSGTRTLDTEGDALDVRGVATFEQAGVDYHAFYDNGRSQIEFTGETDYVNDTFDEFNSTFTVLATKK